MSTTLTLATADLAQPGSSLLDDDDSLPEWLKPWPVDLGAIEAALRHAREVLRLPYHHDLVVSLETEYRFARSPETEAFPS